MHVLHALRLPTLALLQSHCKKFVSAGKCIQCHRARRAIFAVCASLVVCSFLKTDFLCSGHVWCSLKQELHWNYFTRLYEMFGFALGLCAHAASVLCALLDSMLLDSMQNIPALFWFHAEMLNLRLIVSRLQER